MAGGVTRIRPLDRARAERGVRELLLGLGFDADTPLLGRTPERVVEAFLTELLCGHDCDFPELVRGGSDACEAPLDPVLVRDIAIASVCPHHLLIAEGSAMVAYEPGERLLGLGTLVQIVQLASRRLTFQEEIASLVVRVLMDHAGAKGAFCRVSLNHACLRDRGSRETDAVSVSAAWEGTLALPGRLALCLGVEGPPA
jgi:GTP cyclohydrolase IA